MAASTPSSTFSGFVPLPTLVDPLPPAAPPTTLATAVAHSLADKPCLFARLEKDHFVSKGYPDWNSVAYL